MGERVDALVVHRMLDLKMASSLWFVVAVLFVYGFSNAVNLTDGMDGLAAGSADGVRRVRDHRLLAVPSSRRVPRASRGRARLAIVSRR